MIPVSFAPGGPNPVAYRRRSPAAWPRNVAFRASAEVRSLASWTVLLVAGAFGIGMAQVGVRIHATELAYDSLATQQILQKLQLEENDLQAMVERLSSDQRLERVAIVRLGMMRPQKGQHLTLR